MPLDTAQVKATKQPKHNENDKDQADYAAKARQSVASMRVVTATPAEQQQQHDDYEYQAPRFACWDQG